MPDRQQTRPRRDRPDVPPPAWAAGLDVPSLDQLHRELCGRVEVRLLAVPPSLAAAHPGLVAPDAGLARLMQRGRYELSTRIRGAGAYYSFVTRSNSYDDEPDVEWQQDNFLSGFYGGNIGAFLDVGDVDLARLDLEAPPGHLTPLQSGLWAELQAPTLAGQATAHSRAPVVLDHTYLLRAVLEDEHDVLAAFRPVQQDEHGMTIAWRVLRRFGE